MAGSTRETSALLGLRVHTLMTKHHLTIPRLEVSSDYLLGLAEKDVCQA